MMRKKLYSVPEIANLLMRDSEAVRRYIKSGKLKAKKIGKSYFIADASLKTFLGADIYAGVIDNLPSLPADEWEKLDKQASKRAVNKVESEVRDNG